jgi:hypothetical protein
MRLRCQVQAHEARERPDGDYYIIHRPGMVELSADVHTVEAWGRETMSRRRWPQSDARGYDYGRGRWLRCPTLDEQEGNAGEGFGDGYEQVPIERA